MYSVTIMTSMAGTRPRGVGAADEAHGNDAPEHHGELQADLALLVGGEDGDDAVDGFEGIEGMQGAEHQMPGFGGEQGGFDGFQVAHFADQDHVRDPAAGRFAARRQSSRHPRISRAG